MSIYAPTLFGGVSRLCDITGEPLSHDERPVQAGEFIGRLALYGYLGLPFTQPLHNNPEPKLREQSNANAKETFATYLSKSLHNVIDRSTVCARDDNVEEIAMRIGDKTHTLANQLRTLSGGTYSRRSIDWMLQRIAEQYIFDGDEEHWDEGMIRNIGVALALKVEKNRPQRPIDEFYTFLDVIVDLSH